MDRLDMAIALLQEAKAEKENLAEYEKAYANLPTDSNHWNEYAKLLEKYPRIPKKSVINDNIKMARRLLLGEYM